MERSMEHSMEYSMEHLMEHSIDTHLDAMDEIQALDEPLLDVLASFTFLDHVLHNAKAISDQHL